MEKIQLKLPFVDGRKKSEEENKLRENAWRCVSKKGLHYHWFQKELPANSIPRHFWN